MYEWKTIKSKEDLPEEGRLVLGIHSMGTWIDAYDGDIEKSKEWVAIYNRNHRTHKYE